MRFHKIYHLGKSACNRGLKIFPKICTIILRVFYCCDISLKAQIDESVWFCHDGFGIVINPRVFVGEGTVIQHSVTIGEISYESDVPIIGRDCFIGARAVILGNVHIGNNVKIGAGSVVLKDIPDNCTVVGIPTKIVCSKNNNVSTANNSKCRES